MYLVNGSPSTTFDVADRGLHYGDGLFETIEIDRRQAVFLAQHLQRLQTGCQRLRLPVPDLHLLAAEIASLCQAAPEQGQAVIKIIITRGVGGRGYRQPEPIQSSRILSLHPFPDYPDNFQEQGIAARFCQTRLGVSPALAGIKHLNRLEQVLARAEWSDTATQEGLLLNVDGHVIEGTMSNLFYVKDGVVYTALLTRSGVAGVVRGLVMELCRQQPLKLVEHDYTPAALLAADEVFLSNAIIGLWPVRQIDGHVFQVGVLTRHLQSQLRHLKALDREVGHAL